MNEEHERDIEYYNQLIEEIDHQNESLEDTRQSIQNRSQSLFSVTFVIIGLFSSLFVALLWNEGTPLFDFFIKYTNQFGLLLSLLYFLLLFSIVNGFTVIMTNEYEIGFNIIDIYFKTPNIKTLKETVLFEKYKQSIMNEPLVLKIIYNYQLQHIHLFFTILSSVLFIILFMSPALFYHFFIFLIVTFFITRIIFTVNFYSRYITATDNAYQILVDMKDIDRVNLLLSSPIRDFKFNIMKYYIRRKIMKEVVMKEKDEDEYPQPIKSRRMEKAITNTRDKED